MPYIYNPFKNSLDYYQKSGLSLLIPTGAVDDTNTTFVFSQKPSTIIINGQSYREGHGWSWSVLTSTLDTPAGVNGDIFGIA